MSWQPIATAPKKEGAEILAWFQKVKLDEDDNLTDEVVGGAMAHIARQGNGWTEPEWLSAHGSYFFEDWCFAENPVLWHPLPPEPVAADFLGKTPAGVQPSQGPSTKLERWGRADEGSHLLLERRDDGYWTPWHIAQAALDAASGVPGTRAPFRFVDAPKRLQDALLHYHAKPIDSNADALIREVLATYGVKGRRGGEQC